MIVRKLLIKIVRMVLILLVISTIFYSVYTLAINSTDVIRIELNRYAIEGNTTVMSSFYTLIRPGRHYVCATINGNSNSNISLSVIILKRNGSEVILEYNGSSYGRICRDFYIDEKLLYGFIVSRQTIPNNVVVNPYGLTSIVVSIK